MNKTKVFDAFLISLLVIMAAIFCFAYLAHAADWTTAYRLEIPATGDRNWTSKISKDLVSIDATLSILSTDVSAMTTDGVTSVGNAVGRMRILSDDGSIAYILLYGRG